MKGNRVTPETRQSATGERRRLHKNASNRSRRQATARRRAVLRGVLALFLGVVAFASGFTFDSGRVSRRMLMSRGNSSSASTVSKGVFWLPASPAAYAAGDDTEMMPPDTYFSALHFVREHFYAAPGTGGAGDTRLNPKRLTYAAIDGMLATLNERYTEFWTPEEYRLNMEETRGDFVGIGAKLDITKDKRVIITEPLPDSPAALAGVQPGDIIIAINSHSVVGMDLNQVIKQIRGRESSHLTLTLQRRGTAKPLVVNLARAIVHATTVDSRMVDSANKIGYIRLEMFNEQANTQFGAALTRLERQGMRALIFDLRDNPGGLLNAAQDMASRFVDKAPVFWVREKNGRESTLDVEPEQHQNRLNTGAYPIIVLVNGNSASAAEIVCGAIQDSGVGQLLGTTTFGKGLVQTIIPLNDDSAVKITTQHYFTRNKHDINRKRDIDGNPLTGSGGIKPDYVVDFTDKAVLARREALRDNPGDRALADKLDPQLSRAMDILRQQLITGNHSKGAQAARL